MTPTPTPTLPAAHRELREYFEPLAPEPRLVTRGDLIDHLPRARVPRDRCPIDISYAELAVRVMRMVEGDEPKRSALLMFAPQAYFGPLSRAQERLLFLLDKLPEVEGAYDRVRRAVREAFGLSAEIPPELQATLDDAVRTELHAIERARHLSHSAMPPLERLPVELEVLTTSEARCAYGEAVFEYFGMAPRERKSA